VKIGFSKDGLKLNSKKFHPLNFSTKNVTLESDIPVNNVNAIDILSAFQRPDIRSASKEDGIELLKEMLSKIR